MLLLLALPLATTWPVDLQTSLTAVLAVPQLVVLVATNASTGETACVGVGTSTHAGTSAGISARSNLTTTGSTTERANANANASASASASDSTAMLIGAVITTGSTDGCFLLPPCSERVCG